MKYIHPCIAHQLVAGKQFNHETVESGDAGKWVWSLTDQAELEVSLAAALEHGDGPFESYDACIADMAGFIRDSSGNQTDYPCYRVDPETGLVAITIT